jgi:hypothetical protein
MSGRRTCTLALAALLNLSMFTAVAHAATGGTALEPPASEPTEEATLKRNGRAVPPEGAPPQVVKAIRAANRIEDKPYKYGGGHGKLRDSGYDCSGAVSFALVKAGLLDAPLASGGLMRWGKRRAGDWITVYSHSGHAYAVIAGLRWDTSMTPGNGPGWSKKMRSRKGFRARHPRGL